MLQRICFAAVAGLLFASVGVALAQGYPNKPIRLLIGYAPSLPAASLPARLLQHPRSVPALDLEVFGELELA
jgi:hypothetical protein